MNARLLARLVLLVLVAGLSLVLWQGRDPEPGPQSFSPQSSATVQRIRIQPRKGEAITFQRRDRSWYMQSPWPLPAATPRLEAILKLPAMHSLRRITGQQLDLRALGLSPPRVSLWLDDQVYDFGDSNPLNGQRYVRHDGQIHLLTDTVYHQLVTPAASLLDPHPLPRDKHLIRVELPGLILRRHLDGRWRAEPDQPALDRQRLPDFIHHWRELQARGLTRATGPAKGPRLSFFFADRSHIRFTLETRDDGPWLIRERPALAYRLPDSLPVQGLLTPFAIITPP